MVSAAAAAAAPPPSPVVCAISFAPTENRLASHLMAPSAKQAPVSGDEEEYIRNMMRTEYRHNVIFSFSVDGSLTAKRTTSLPFHHKMLVPFASVLPCCPLLMLLVVLVVVAPPDRNTWLTAPPQLKQICWTRGGQERSDGGDML